MSASPNASADSAPEEELEFRILQLVWDLRIGHEEFLQSPIWPVILSVVFYFSFCFPFMMADLFCRNQAWYKKYKIQPDKEVTLPLIWDTLSLTFWNHILFVLPAAVAQWIWVPSTPLPKQAPTLFEFVFQQGAAILIFDFQYFVWHWTHHKVRFLYRHIHSVHHNYSSPFCWVTQYLHPWELVTVGFLYSTNTWFFNCHCLTTWSYMLYGIIISVEAHIGFDFPLLPHNWSPFDIYGGSPKHDMHHQKPMTNFQPYFNYFDRLFGFYCPPQRAGGYKPKDLLDYERRSRETKKQG